MTLAEIRSAFTARYPDVDDDQCSIAFSGFVHEHPMTAIGVVLISSVWLDTTDVDQLAGFTKYSKMFIRAISVNMKNSHLWNDAKYDCAGWSCGNRLPRNKKQDIEFWEHIEVAAGSMWTQEADSDLSEDACTIFWNLKRVN
jgi:hypothetical protein